MPSTSTSSLIEILGLPVVVRFLVRSDRILAYAWHRDEGRAIRHLRRIKEYHSLEGEEVESKELEEWLAVWLRRVVLGGERFSLPEHPYRGVEAYRELLKVGRGETITYGELARRSGLPSREVLMALMRNPFQVLIPCHRLLTRTGGLMGFHPLGVEVKRRLLELEGVKLSSRPQ